MVIFLSSSSEILLFISKFPFESKSVYISIFISMNNPKMGFIKKLVQLILKVRNKQHPNAWEYK